MVTMRDGPPAPMDGMAEEMAAVLAETLEEDIDVAEMELPVDESLEVVITSLPGDEYEESHTHVLPEADAIVLHLTPPEAQQFDGEVKEFVDDKDL